MAFMNYFFPKTSFYLFIATWISDRMDWSAGLRFKEFTDFLQSMVEMKKSSRTQHLQKFLQHCRGLVEKSSGDKSLYPVVRLLLPQLDKERGAYKMKVGNK